MQYEETGRNRDIEVQKRAAHGDNEYEGMRVDEADNIVSRLFQYGKEALDIVCHEIISHGISRLIKSSQAAFCK